MSSILATLSNLITPEMVGNLGKQFGMSDELTRQGLVIANAVLAGGMARAASTPEGAGALTKLIDSADSSVISNLSGVAANVLGGKTINIADGAVGQLFGSNLELVTNGVKKATGIDIGPMLAVCAPVMLGVVKNMAAQQQLDADGIAKLLQTEVRGLSRRDANTGKVIKEVFKPLEAQDKVRNAFTSEEWALLQNGPLHAAGLVILSDRSGGGGVEKEIDALQAALDEAAAAAGPAELLGLLFRDRSAVGPMEDLVKAHRRTEPEALQTAMLGPVTEALLLARAKASKSDTVAYQGLLIGASQKVAGAAKEGGFLGMGGVDVSDKEKAALDALAAAIAAA
jgi:hypothetical protein